MTTIDVEKVHGWASSWYADAPGYVAVWRNPRKDSRHVAASDPAGIAAAVQALGVEGQDVYLSACTLHTAPDSGRGSEEHVGTLLGVWADIDIAGPTHKDSERLPPDTAAALTIVERLPTPTVVVHSGGGLQPWWRFHEPWVLHDDDERRRAAEYLHRWGEVVAKAAADAGYRTDLGVFELARVMRPPGTTNYKAQRASTGDALPSDYLDGHLAGVRYTPDQLAVHFPPVASAPPPAPVSRLVHPAGGWSAAEWINANVSWEDILVGWHRDHTDRDGVTYWVRPGKNPRDGHSATTRETPPVLVNFSDEVDLPAGKGHRLTKFRVYAWAFHNGDESAAATAVTEQHGPDATLARLTPSAGEAPARPDDSGMREMAAQAAVANEVQKLRTRRAAQRLVDAEERPPVQLPEILTLADRLARPRISISYRIQGWQPAQTRLVLAAQYKAGKTTLVGNLVRCLVDGAPFLGTATVTPVRGRVVILDTEMGEHQLDDWLADQKIIHVDRVVPIPLRGKVAALDLLDAGVRQRWAERLKQLQAEYVVLDVLRPVLDVLGLNEHTEAGRFLVAFDQLLDEAGVPDAAVIHHMGHTGERSRGDSRIRDWPDVEWRLVREDTDDPASPRFISAYGRDVDVSESLLEFDSTTRHLTLLGGSRRDQGLSEVVEAVLAVLDDGRELSQRKIEEALHDLPRNDVRRAIKRVVGEGSVVVKDGPKRSKLHSINPVRRSAPTSAPRTESECASALIDGALHSLDADHPLRTAPNGALNDQPNPVVANLLEEKRAREAASR